MCLDALTTNGFKSEVMRPNAPKEIKEAIDLVKKWCAFMCSGDPVLCYYQNVGVCPVELKLTSRNNPFYKLYNKFQLVNASSSGKVSKTRMPNHFSIIMIKFSNQYIYFEHVIVVK